ncbi:MAG: sulfotransferase [Halioglobus sp.]|nr:sulfotransferase [Halioglobus sp.]
MQYPSPNQPAGIKVINRIGRGLRKLRIERPSLLPAEALIRNAEKQTGLGDFGDESFIPALEKLTFALEREARLSQLGRIAVRGMLLDNLKLRLHLTEYRKRRPEVAQQKITRPLFVLGLPRTGTTILYELLAQDPAHRAPATWEVAQPIPPAQRHSFHTDPRIPDVEKHVQKMELLAPGFQAIHAMGAELPQECVALLAPHFISDQFGVSFYIPEYRHWTLAQDMTAAYQWHHQFLQHLQVDYREQRWVLKTPPHLAYLDTLIQQYPDAAIVQTHRAPMDVLGSISSLSCTLHSAFSDDIDPIAIAQAEVDYFSAMLAQGMEKRAGMADESSRIYDVQFDDMLSDPIAVCESLYKHFDFDFSDEVRQAMQAYLESRPRDKHGSHHYSLEQFGLSQRQHGELFADYCKRFGL